MVNQDASAVIFLDWKKMDEDAANCCTLNICFQCNYFCDFSTVLYNTIFHLQGYMQCKQCYAVVLKYCSNVVLV